MKTADILIVGAGPAGIAAAVRAAESGRRVTILDDNIAEGGQIWRGGRKHASDSYAALWFQQLAASGATVLSNCRVIGGDPHQHHLRVEQAEGFFEIAYGELILATGARELFLPFPGWTLPNVMGVGGLQALVKSGLSVRGKRIVVAGTGPLLLAVADYLRKHGGDIPVIAEQALWRSVLGFGARLLRHPGKLWQAAQLRTSLGTTRYLQDAWVTAAQGDDRVRRIQLQTGSRIEAIECDYLALGYGLSPNVELPEFLGCQINSGVVEVDELQRTSMKNIFCAGEVTGVGGVDLSLVEGQIAGYSAAGSKAQATRLFPIRTQARNFADSLNQAFALRKELRELPDADTAVCRCEDVPYGKLQKSDSWRAAKLHLRCGMGPCQGRICGPAVEFLFGWNRESVRPPIFPARVASLLSSEIEEGIKR